MCNNTYKQGSVRVTDEHLRFLRRWLPVIRLHLSEAGRRCYAYPGVIGNDDAVDNRSRRKLVSDHVGRRSERRIRLAQQAGQDRQDQRAGIGCWSWTIISHEIGGSAIMDANFFESDAGNEHP